MQVVRFIHPQSGQPVVGVAADGAVTALPGVTLADLLARGADGFRDAVTGASGPVLAADTLAYLPPVDGVTEVWAAGVTYRRSREARVEESGQASVYELVYEADRPELFFKAPAWRVVGPDQPVTVRADSGNDVPEPELGLVLDHAGVVVGYTVGNDMTSRAIEGRNPLYLPQAKIWRGSCALGPGIRPAWEVGDGTGLGIHMTIHRDGGVAFAGKASTDQLNRTLPELAGWLFRELDHPAGAVLLTGTCVVPELAFTLRSGDTIEITVDEVGTLSNQVA
ncbi:fumarylacetoacetate hydrolase family protein [Actinocatenispora rupis]|uniref:Fumarylacetoacetate (FAA) hydrolase n=1 Tax=Actinocatenispora rupis TaxID=519421 RepID=A0A8J3NBI4_9ACTN|nr:fumarylacetoacetate hydrolase family protein [Actinocatenispora rupis]GID13101.1 fumarylacetoacetate (FAA) hydrolase [Actinocatenispora rupis]